MDTMVKVSKSSIAPGDLVRIDFKYVPRFCWMPRVVSRVPRLRSRVLFAFKVEAGGVPMGVALDDTHVLIRGNFTALQISENDHNLSDMVD